MNASWPFADLPAPRMQFPGRLFSNQEAIIEAPYLPVANLLSPRYYEFIHEAKNVHQIFHLLHSRQTTLHIGPMEGAPSLERQFSDPAENGTIRQQNRNGRTEVYLEDLMDLMDFYCTALDRQNVDEQPLNVRLKDGLLARQFNITMGLYDSWIPDPPMYWKWLSHPNNKI